MNRVFTYKYRKYHYSIDSQGRGIYDQSIFKEITLYKNHSFSDINISNHILYTRFRIKISGSEKV